MTNADRLEDQWPARDDIPGDRESAQASAASGVDAAAAPSVQLLFIGEVAELFRCCERTIRRWVRLGNLPAVRIGGALRFRDDDIAILLRSELRAGQRDGRSAGIGG